MDGLWPYVAAAVFGTAVGFVVRRLRGLEHQRCPNCDERIRRRAKVCPRCHQATGWA